MRMGPARRRPRDQARDARRAHRRHRRAKLRAGASRGGGRSLPRLAADASPAPADELRPPLGARSLTDGPSLLFQFFEQASEHPSEVAASKALVPVGAYCQADDDVGVRELVRLARDVLAHERHREKAPRRGHARAVRGLQQLNVLGGEQAVGYPVYLGQHVRQQRAQPIASEVDHLERVVLGLLLYDPRSLGGALGPREVRAHVVIGHAPSRAVSPEPQLSPLRQQGHELGVVPGLVQ